MGRDRIVDLFHPQMLTDPALWVIRAGLWPANDDAPRWVRLTPELCERVHRALLEVVEAGRRA